MVNKKMNYSRKKNALFNIIIGYIAQLGILVLSFVGRKIFLHFLSIDYLGINGLYSNILSVLSFAELGLDSAVVYSLYKPVAENDQPKIAALIHYFKKIYFALACVILLFGISLIPFLKFIINSNLSYNDLVIYYILFLINIVSSYFVAHKIALLSASQQQRIQRIVSLISSLLLQILHIIALCFFPNYYLYIIITVFNTIVYNICLGIICDRIHPEIKESYKNVEIDKKQIVKKIKATVLYRLGVVAINNTDNILISYIVSTAAVGLYANYFSLISAIQGFVSVINTSLISGIGNLAAAESRKRQYELFNLMLFFYHLIAAICGIGFSILFNNVIELWIGKEYLFEQPIVYVIAFNYYLTNAINPIWMYREANGLFDKVKFLVLIRALVNIVLSIVLGQWLGTFGILLATTISLLVTSFWFEPTILFKTVFQRSQIEYWLKQIKYFLLTIFSLLICYNIFSLMSNSLISVLVEIIVVIIITVSLFVTVNIHQPEVKEMIMLIKQLLLNLTKKIKI